MTFSALCSPSVKSRLTTAGTADIFHENWCSIMERRLGYLILLILAVAEHLLLKTEGGAVQEREGFMSLSCGGNRSYTDASNISWVPDDPYIETGKKAFVTYSDGKSMVNTTLRFFAESKIQNCYKIPLQRNSPILVRSTFVYKNYDGLRRPPVFHLSLGITAMAKVSLSIYDPWVEEFISAEGKDDLSFCIVSIPDGGIPLISSLEIRPLPEGAYSNGTGLNSDRLLRKMIRINCGYTANNLRYPVDPYDRIWEVDNNFSPKHLSAGFSTPVKIDNSDVQESPPEFILQSARVLVRSNNLSYNFKFDEEANYFIIMYFARILPLDSTFQILANEETIAPNYTLTNRDAGVIPYTTQWTSTINITLQNVSFYPQINALEIHKISTLDSSPSKASALQVIAKVYGMNLGWENDPCSPIPWNGLECDDKNEVISLNLSNMNLKGPIAPAFGDLLELQTLDLHNNSLTGQIEIFAELSHLRTLNLSFNKLNERIPDLSNLASLEKLDLRNNSLQGRVPQTLGALPNLKYINLENNHLYGTLPNSLNRPLLDLRTSGNLCLIFPGATCSPGNPSLETPKVTEPKLPRRKKHGSAILVGVLCAIAIAFIGGVALIVWYKRKGDAGNRLSISKSDIRNWNAARRFTFKEIKIASNSFKDTIGRGSFGSVYLGKLPDGKRVAVKVRFDPSLLAADSFINEVFVLSQVHHQNLVSLEGFCQESKHQILVYEYLPEGALTDHLYGSKAKCKTLDWRRRLKIAVDAAAGIEYLHNGTNPKIIHRDVKCSNILLDSNLNAKVCDFGLSKQMVHTEATHVTTVVKGTAGYLDPEYYSTQQLTEKSDVYSFGVVLLELICGREPLTHTGSPDSYNLVLWAKPYLQAGDYNVIDKNLNSNYGMESMKKAAAVACRCVERDVSHRPGMAEVLYELKAALALELAENAPQSPENVIS